MPQVSGNQNTYTNTTNNLSTDTPSTGSSERTRPKGGVFGGVFPRATHRTAQNMRQHAENMQAPTDTQHIGDVSAINDALSRRALTRYLSAWQEAAPMNEYAARETAKNRILECMTNKNPSLDLKGLQLTSLPKKAFQYLPSLRELDLRDNCLESIDAPSFAILESLNISRNRLKTLDLSGCDQLQHLECTGNPLATLNFSDCEQLTYLDARWNNNLRHLAPPNPTALRDVKLEGSGVCFENLPQALRDITSIVIDISPFELSLRAWQEAAPLDEQIARATTINIIRECKINRNGALDLSGLQLTSLPENIFQHIPSLRELDISNNRLGVVDLSHYIPLRRLAAHSNPLLIDLRLHERTSLGQLTLADTGITFEDLPQTIREIEYISIDILGPYVEPRIQAWENAAPEDERAARGIAANRIRDCIANSSEYLNLSHLGISSLPENVLKHIPSLCALDLSNNWGTNHRKFFSLNLESLRKLTHLNISNNYMASILSPNLNLSGFTKLRELSCRNTKFWNIDLSGCNHVLSVDLSSAILRSINLRGCHQLQILLCDRGYFHSLDLSETLVQYLSAHSNYFLQSVAFPRALIWMRRIELANTRVRIEALPLEIRNNLNIFIDIRPRENTPPRQNLNIPVNQNLNHHQNTHTASIHRSASRNATLLRDRNRANLNESYERLATWVQERPTLNRQITHGHANDDFRNHAAQEWMQERLHIDHIDQRSQISVKDFLALAWLAINDDNQREPTAPLPNARESLRDALYEIRRGDNLDAGHNPIDNGHAAVNICAGGTFNKISEKLVSVVRDMSSTVITQETFTFSLHATIRRAIAALMRNNRNILPALNANDGLLTETIWNQIRNNVRTQMYAEFDGEGPINNRTVEQFFNESTVFEGVLEYLDVSPETLVNIPEPTRQERAYLRYATGSTFHLLAIIAALIAAAYYNGSFHHQR